ncbi:type II toxin-antitoxin system RelE/ParE family toxin [uncultured Mucilaginibacter sp.]|uniref:type II toxin-antitoxin system RelE/ParE family toxin n=1 Tax=uncultured Mucilaginibacter sp. TaxID=797541 RepID=UPI0025E62921|nr:type II toxin-antitoxin system RelE/ParE family toxin [uncultured Mucilaginibacter sp.]
MAKTIIWSARADNDLFDILDYWANRNRSDVYSIKLKGLIDDCVNLIAELPDIGKPTGIPNLRLKILRDYLIFYNVSADHLEIITIWDSRRNPKKLSDILKRI